MNWVDVLIMAVIAAVFFLAGFAVYRSKKRGNACIGCPDSKNCAHKCNGSCGCCHH